MCRHNLIKKIHTDEGGMLSLVSLLAVLLFLVLAGLVANVGLTANQKMEVQNAADSSAYSSALWLARGYNAVTATNHIIGEIMGLVVVHSAIAEKHDFYEPKQTDRFPPLAYLLRTTYETASRLAAFPTVAYDQIKDDAEVKPTKDDIKAGATVSDGRYQLMRSLTATYAVKTVAGICEKIPFPPITALGYALDGLCLAVETDILLEWMALKGLYFVYRGAKPVSDLFFDTLIPAAHAYEHKVIPNLTPQVAGAATPGVAKLNGATGALYPKAPPMYLEDDPWGIKGQGENQDQFLVKSQLVRATYPWVQYHRRPIVNVLNFLKISRAAYYMVYYTNDYTLKKSREQYQKHQTYLQVLRDSNPENKGREPWTNNSRMIDQRFTVIAFTHRQTPKYASAKIMGQPNQEGLVAYAQALVYNANPQNPDKGPPAMQPEVGWDTLNWGPPIGTSNAFECPLDPDPDTNGHNEPTSPRRPVVRLNWQAKLIPVSSYLDEAVRNTPGPHQGILQRMIPVPPLFKTH